MGMAAVRALGRSASRYCKKRLTLLAEYESSPTSLIGEWWAVFIQAYSQQAMRALRAAGKYANPAMAAVVLFSFATAPAWPGPFVALLVVLLAFVIRDAYIHGREPYRTDGITDAA